MLRNELHKVYFPVLLVILATLTHAQQFPPSANGGSFMVQCPATTITHPTVLASGAPEPLYLGPTQYTLNSQGYQSPIVNVNGTIKCQHISGGDGYMTEADGNQTFMFSFGPLSGLDSIRNGQPGTLLAADFNNYYNEPTLPGRPNQFDPGYDPGKPLSSNGAVANAGTIMSIGVMNGNIPAPLMAFNEDDEFFLTLSNVGMIMRPDLFEEHTVHFHGYPNASSFYDGVPDATWAINIGGSATYYYLAPDAGTYFWHCHITPPEHLQMGMVGQLYVRPRQNRVPLHTDLYQSLLQQQSDLRTACNVNADILCSTPLPPGDNSVTQKVDPFAGVDPRIPANTPSKYAYNDGDGSTAYQFDVPIQIHGFDPNFHFVGMTFNPEGFADMKDKYFLLNGRSYPDTIGVPGYAGLSATSTNPDSASNAISTQDSDGVLRPSQPMPTLITLKQGEKALLRISDLDVTEYQTLASLGIPMTVVGFNAKLLRDQAGNNLYIKTNSITLGGGESLDAILDSTGVTPGTYFLYTPNLDHLSNDAENFGGLMTEVVVTP